jgi:hypothetical protein
VPLSFFRKWVHNLQIIAKKCWVMLDNSESDEGSQEHMDNNEMPKKYRKKKMNQMKKFKKICLRTIVRKKFKKKQRNRIMKKDLSIQTL